MTEMSDVSLLHMLSLQLEARLHKLSCGDALRLYNQSLGGNLFFIGPEIEIALKGSFPSTSVGAQVGNFGLNAGRAKEISNCRTPQTC